MSTLLLTINTDFSIECLNHNVALIKKKCLEKEIYWVFGHCFIVDPMDCYITINIPDGLLQNI